MTKIVQFPSVNEKTHMNHEVTSKIKDREQYINVIEKMKRRTGLDFHKIAIGDEKENTKLRFYQLQESLIVEE